jgi:oxygen-independent coproporphyrinogen-3 oxidase
VSAHVVQGARHLYVHLPFCSSRCGYCDFVTVVGRDADHGRYVDALLLELELERRRLAECLETVYLGGGTPTLTDSGSLTRLLDALPVATEVTIEANPETVTPGWPRCSLGESTASRWALRFLDASPADTGSRCPTGRRPTRLLSSS